MRIAQIAPLYERVPPKLYGGTERIVAYLTDELVRQGHEVTLFASGDSRTQARLVPVGSRATRLDPNCRDSLARHILLLEKVFAQAREFDVLHFHVEYLHFPLSRRCGVPNLTTLHGRMDLPDLTMIYGEFRDMPLVSISDAQRLPLPHLNWQRTIYHGLPRDLYKCRQQPGDYLAFLGRISPEKRPDRAIQIAEQAAVPLLMAGKIDPVDREYFDDHVRELLKNPWVEFIGEIGEGEKDEFLGKARALLFPIDWPEPFGLVMIEAMACGTPTIAYPCGSVPEILEDGVTGFLVRNEREAVHAVDRAAEIDREACRQIFERRFSVEHMALAYSAVYSQVSRPASSGGEKDERAA